MKSLTRRKALLGGVALVVLWYAADDSPFVLHRRPRLSRVDGYVTGVSGGGLRTRRVWAQALAANGAACRARGRSHSLSAGDVVSLRMLDANSCLLDDDPRWGRSWLAWCLEIGATLGAAWVGGRQLPVRFRGRVRSTFAWAAGVRDRILAAALVVIVAGFLAAALPSLVSLALASPHPNLRLAVVAVSMSLGCALLLREALSKAGWSAARHPRLRSCCVGAFAMVPALVGLAVAMGPADAVMSAFRDWSRAGTALGLFGAFGVATHRWIFVSGAVDGSLVRRLALCAALGVAVVLDGAFSESMHWHIDNRTTTDLVVDVHCPDTGGCVELACYGPTPVSARSGVAFNLGRPRTVRIATADGGWAVCAHPSKAGSSTVTTGAERSLELVESQPWPFDRWLGRSQPMAFVHTAASSRP